MKDKRESIERGAKLFHTAISKMTYDEVSDVLNYIDSERVKL